MEEWRQSRRASIARRLSVCAAAAVAGAALIPLALRVRHQAVDGGQVAEALVAAVLTGGVFTWMVRRLLTGPLRALETAAAAIREGRLDAVRVPRSGDEVEAIGESLSALSQALAESRTGAGAARQRVEEQVRERTQAIEESARRALEASRAKSEFLASISHELRTPMNGVLGMLDMVLDTPLDEGQRDQVETARACANTLLGLLNDLLDLSKIEAGSG
jgi:signal transduction histidine kinase